MAGVTVAAVILFRDFEAALADAGGRAAVRREVETAWAGGATPIVVVSADPSGGVAAALAGSPAVLAEPAPLDGGPVAQIGRGMRVAAERVRDTEAALVWPGRMAWVDAETVTTLIEAYGLARGTIVRPRYGTDAGWPVLVPSELARALAALEPDRTPEQLVEALVAAGAGLLEVDTGDPGTVHDLATPIDELPAYQAPPEPAKPPPEWGAAVAEMGDEGPMQGPHLAPYPQAAEEGE